MKSVQIVLADIYAGGNTFCDILCDTCNSIVIDLSQLLRHESTLDTQLAKNLRANLDSGEIINTKYLNQIIDTAISNTTKNIIIKDYPRTKDQYIGLLNLLKEKSLSIEKIWHLELMNLDYISQKELIKVGAKYSAKYDINKDTLKDKIIEKKGHLNKTIDLIRKDFKISTIGIDYEKTPDIKDFIKNKITMPNKG